MEYPVQTMAQLPVTFKNLRKAKGFTQMQMAEKLGITQQTYASFELNPGVASFERVFTVLALLEVDLVLQERPRGDASESGSPATPGGW